MIDKNNGENVKDEPSTIKQLKSYLPKYMTPAEYAAMVSLTTKLHRQTGRGSLNAYVCRDCHNIRITIDRDPGVTPLQIVCDRCPNYKFIGKMKFPQAPRLMISANYQISPGVTEAMATYEFYRPSFEFYSDIKHVGTKRHVEAGGLIMRKIGELMPENGAAMIGKK